MKAATTTGTWYLKKHAKKKFMMTESKEEEMLKGIDWIRTFAHL